LAQVNLFPRQAVFTSDQSPMATVMAPVPLAFFSIFLRAKTSDFSTVILYRDLPFDDTPGYHS
jgi:hypothetical protein